MQSWTKRDYFTYLALFVLLFVRFPIADFVLFLEQLFKPFVFSVNLESLRLLQSQSVQFLYGYSFILVAMVIVVNKDNLSRLNIDKRFVLIFLCGGLAYNWDANWKLGLATAIVSLFVFILDIRGLLKFGDKESNLLRIVLVIAIVFFLGILFISESIDITKVHWAAQWFLEDIPIVVVEEVMFRGMLWMFLKDLNFSEFKIVVIQAILFWLSHVYAANNLTFFWIITPIASILLGIIVWRSKSITPSAIAHILINLSLGLFASRNL